MTIDRLCTALVAAVLSIGATFATGKEFPSRPIRIVVAGAPGGSTDILARSIGRVIQEQTGMSVVVDNRAGAGGLLGVTAVTKAPPDGYTLLLTPPDAVSLMPHLKKDLPYSAERELTPIAMVAETPFTFVVSAKSPYKTIADVVLAAKIRPGTVTYGSTGLGGSGHIYTELIQQRAGVAFLTVPYKGASPAVMSVVSGETELTTSSPATLKPYIESGQLRALLVSKPNRSSILPNVPTAAEVGLQDMALSAWYGVFAPAPLPQGIANRLSSILAQALASPELQRQITDLGLENRSMGHMQFAKFFVEDSRRWGQIIAAGHITLKD